MTGRGEKGRGQGMGREYERTKNYLKKNRNRWRREVKETADGEIQKEQVVRGCWMDR